MKKVFKTMFSLGVLMALLFSMGTAFAANQFSTMTPLLRSKLNEGSNYNNSLGWSTSTSGVGPGDTVALTVFLYNPNQQQADNVIITLQPQSTGVVSQQTFTASVSANGFTTANGSTSVSLNTPNTLTFTGIDSQGVNAVAIWKDLGGGNGTSDATVTYVDGSALFNGGLNIGSLPADCVGDWGCHQGALVLHFRAGQAQQQSQCSITNFTATPSNVSYGSSTTLNWSSTGCTSATITGPGVSSSNQSPNGSTTTSALYASGTYTITAYGPGGSDSRTTYVTVNNQQSCTISAYASPTSVSYGGSSTLYWSSNGATSVSISGLNYNNNYNQSLSGSVTTGAIYGTQTYTFTANCQNGQSQTQTVYVYTNQQQTYQCNDGIDNDGDGRIDMNDPGCTSIYDNDEYNQATVSVITTNASNITQSSARLNGLLVNSGGYATNGYFQWGTTSALGFSTASLFIGSNNQQSFFNTITGLSANTTYYYRAVATNTLGTFYGDIVSFVTPPTTVVTPPTVITTVVSGTGSGSNLVQLEITPNNINVVGISNTGVTTATSENPIIANVCVADHVSYRVYYKNISGRTLNDAILHVELPKDVAFEGTTAGIYNASDSTITLPIGTLIRNQEGTFFITVTVLRSAVDRDLLVATATITIQNPTSLARENAIAYGLVSTTQCAKNGLLGLALFSGFWPTSLLGWLLLLFLVLLVVYLATRMYRDRRRPMAARPAPHYEDMDVPTYRPGN
jgi:hypothetical protein